MRRERHPDRPRRGVRGGRPQGGDRRRAAGDGLAFSVVRLEVVVTTADGQEDALRELVEVAKKSCLVARSLACPVELAANVRTDGRSGHERRAAV